MHVAINGCSLKKQEEGRLIILSPLQVANIQALSSKLEVQSSQLTSDLQACEQRSFGMAAKRDQLVQEAQKTHDTRVCPMSAP